MLAGLRHEATRKRWWRDDTTTDGWHGLDRAALDEQIAFTRPAGTVWLARWQGIVHCANHATQHRSELAMMLTDLGRSPGDMDMFLWMIQPR